MTAPREEPPEPRELPSPVEPPLRLVRPSDAVVSSETAVGRGAASITDTRPPRTPSFLSGFRALRHRDFRLFFAGQLVSLVGTWMQSLAQSWLVLTLTNSPFALGLVGALQFLPVLFLSPFGGTIADRFPKRKVLLATQSTMMLLAFVLAALVWAKVVTFAEILIVAFLLGLANSIDMPTRQAFVVELVGPDDLMNAIALNSTMFNLARLIGPAVGGLLIAVVGIAICFFLNGVSFIAVLIGLALMRLAGVPPRRLGAPTQVFADLREGFRYVRHTPAVLGIILLLGAVGTFGINFNVLTPLLAYSTLRVGPVGLGWLTTAMGAGSLVASLAIAYLAKQPRPALILGAAAAFGLLEVLLGPARSFPADLALLALVGAMQVTFASQANTFVQLVVPHQLRGRVMAIYMMLWAGTTPIGNTIVGALAESTGTLGPFLLGGIASLLAVVAVVPTLRHAVARPAPLPASPGDRGSSAR
jgi:MFS family permease